MRRVTRGAPMEEATVHGAAVPRLHRQLAALGLDATSLMREAGLDRVHLAGHARAPRAAFLRAKALAARELGEVRLGLMLGASTDLDDLDVFGAAISHAATLEDALSLGHRFHEVWEQGSSATLQRGGGRIVVHYEPGSGSDAVAARVDGLQSVVFLARCVVRLVPEAEGSLRVGSRTEAPPDVDAGVLSGLRRATFRFGAPSWHVDLPEGLARTPLQRAHPVVTRMLHDALDAEQASLRRTDDVVARTRELGRRGLPLGWALPDVARALGVSSRTLQERLTERGTTWSAVLAEARLGVARELLDEDGLSLDDVAARCGFASTSALARFFRRQAGTSPAAWRSRRDG